MPRAPTPLAATRPNVASPVETTSHIGSVVATKLKNAAPEARVRPVAEKVNDAVPEAMAFPVATTENDAAPDINACPAAENVTTA